LKSRSIRAMLSFSDAVIAATGSKLGRPRRHPTLVPLPEP
jgi:hypothetical protein